MDFDLIEIERDSSIPISKQIADLIVKNIEIKNILLGEKLPTEKEISEKLNVSRGTIKNAYKKLELNKVIETIQGSGSFTIVDHTFTKSVLETETYSIIDETISLLKKRGLSNEAIIQLTNSRLTTNAKTSLSIAIVYDNQELLLDFKEQLSYIKNVQFSIFILESLTSDANPEKIMNGYDLIITPTDYFKEIKKLLPNLVDRLIEVSVSPSLSTIIDITSLNRDFRIGIICRSNVFLSIIKNTLLTYGFLNENIFSYFEMDYTTETYFQGGINALISFSSAHIFTDENFRWRNDELIAKGGKIIKFKYKIEKGALIYLEDKISGLLKKN